MKQKSTAIARFEQELEKSFNAYYRCVLNEQIKKGMQLAKLKKQNESKNK